jgi:hypothetical protein
MAGDTRSSMVQSAASVIEAHGISSTSFPKCSHTVAHPEDRSTTTFLAARSS